MKHLLREYDAWLLPFANFFKNKSVSLAGGIKPVLRVVWAFLILGLAGIPTAALYLLKISGANGLKSVLRIRRRTVSLPDQPGKIIVKGPTRTCVWKVEAMSISVPRTQGRMPTEPRSREATIPPLENGDRLTRDEFMRRYDAMPELKKAELIEGVVYVPSPVRHKYHGQQHSDLISWFGFYRAGTPGVKGSDNATVLLDPTNSPQPDGLLFIHPDHGGQVQLDEEGYIVGAPDLVAEVAASTASYDLHDKLEAYRRSGVREYLVWCVYDERIDWFVLREGRYEPLVPAADGSLRSTVFPGLWLDPAALLRGDLAAVLALVQQGLNSPEHAEFAAKLSQARAKPAG